MRAARPAAALGRATAVVLVLLVLAIAADACWAADRVAASPSPVPQDAPAVEAAAGPPVAAPPPEATPSAPSSAGPVRIDVSVDRKTVTLGDPIAVTVRLLRPRDFRVTLFAPELTLGDLVLLGPPASATTNLTDGRVQETRSFRVARYAMGDSRVPSFEATFMDGSGKEGKVATPPVRFSVGSILAEGDVRPADIKNPAVMPVPPLWPWILVAAAGAGLLAWWLWRRPRRRGGTAVTAAAAAPARPPHETAYAELERLLSSGLLEKGRVKEFYIELAEIVRRYLEARFGVDTFERTTAEILEGLRLARLPAKGMALASDFLRACDLVKFAKYVPQAEETRSAVELAYLLIDETRQRDSAPAGEIPAPVRGAAAGAAP